MLGSISETTQAYPIQNERPSTFTLDGVFDIWRRRKWPALLAVAAGLIATETVVSSLPNLYRANATVLVDRPQVSETFVRPSVTAELETRIQTIHQRVMSRARLSEIIKQFNLYPESRADATLDGAINRVRQDMSLTLKGVDSSNGRGTIAFTVAYSGRDPQTVADVTNALAGLYVQENTQNRERQATQTSSFLKGQLNAAKRELDDQDRRTRDYRLRFSGELQQADLTLSTVDRLTTQLRMNSDAQARAMERREGLEHQIAEANRPTLPVATQGVETTPTLQLMRLRQELSELRSKFSEQYPDVVRKRAEIATAEQEVARAKAAEPRPSGSSSAPATSSPTEVLQQSIARIDREMKSLKDEESSLRQGIARYQSRVDNAPARQQEFMRLNRDYDAVKERYQTLLKQSEDARVTENLEQGQDSEQFRILDAAIPPAWPAAPDRTLLQAMGLVASLALGFAVIVGAEKIDGTFHDVDDLRGFTNLRTLATIRLIHTKKLQRQRRAKAAMSLLFAILALAATAGISYYVASGNERLVRLTSRAGS